MSYPPVIAFTLAHGLIPGEGSRPAWPSTSGRRPSFGVVASYAALLRWIGGARLQRAVGYVQLVAGVVAYGGFFLSRSLRPRPSSAGHDAGERRVPASSRLVCELHRTGRGRRHGSTWIRAALSMLPRPGRCALLRGRLSLDYAERIVRDSAGDAPCRDRGPGRTWFFARGDRARWQSWSASHFRHDIRVRMGLFGVAPLMLMYMVLGMRSRQPRPVPARRGTGRDFLAMAALMFPAIVTRQLETSEAYRAAWIYTRDEGHHARLIVALKKSRRVFPAPFARALRASSPGASAILTRARAYRDPRRLRPPGVAGRRAAEPELPFAHQPKKSGGTTMFVWMSWCSSVGNCCSSGCSGSSIRRAADRGARWRRSGALVALERAVRARAGLSRELRASEESAKNERTRSE